MGLFFRRRGVEPGSRQTSIHLGMFKWFRWPDSDARIVQKTSDPWTGRVPVVAVFAAASQQRELTVRLCL